MAEATIDATGPTLIALAWMGVGFVIVVGLVWVLADRRKR